MTTAAVRAFLSPGGYGLDSFYYQKQWDFPCPPEQRKWVEKPLTLQDVAQRYSLAALSACPLTARRQDSSSDQDPSSEDTSASNTPSSSKKRPSTSLASEFKSLPLLTVHRLLGDWKPPPEFGRVLVPEDTEFRTDHRDLSLAATWGETQVTNAQFILYDRTIKAMLQLAGLDGGHALLDPSSGPRTTTRSDIHMKWGKQYLVCEMTRPESCTAASFQKDSWSGATSSIASGSMNILKQARATLTSDRTDTNELQDGWIYQEQPASWNSELSHGLDCRTLLPHSRASVLDTRYLPCCHHREPLRRSGRR